ncbi:hypothetical protein [Microbacterium aureliae]
MGEDASDELRALRARAYGPGADISSDPDALRRLAELEARTRAPLAETERELAPPPEQARPRRPSPSRSNRHPPPAPGAPACVSLCWWPPPSC